MPNDHTKLLAEAREELQAAREARGSTTADGRAVAAGLASIAASLLVIAERGRRGEEFGESVADAVPYERGHA